MKEVVSIINGPYTKYFIEAHIVFAFNLIKKLFYAFRSC